MKPLLQGQKQASIHPRCLQAWSSEEGAEKIFPFSWICLLHARLVPRRHPCQVLKEVFFSRALYCHLLEKCLLYRTRGNVKGWGDVTA